jgi:homoserine O-acetyltransferase/O-succinyltransferase
MLGSSFGSTNPATINPTTGKPYGPDFPRLTVGDMVRAQRLLLDYLGVKHLVAVAGPSYGGFQAFQWAVTYPDFMHGIVAVVTAPKNMRPNATEKLIQQLAEDPNWNGGWYYDRGGVTTVLTNMRIATLKLYNIEVGWRRNIPTRRRAKLRLSRLPNHGLRTSMPTRWSCCGAHLRHSTQRHSSGTCGPKSFT